MAHDYVGSYAELYRLCDQAALDLGGQVEGIKREVIMFEPDIVCMQEVQWMGVIFYKFKLSVVRAVEFKSDITSALVSDTLGLICKLIPLAVPTTPLLGATTRLHYQFDNSRNRPV